MDIIDFKASLEDNTPPIGLTIHQEALWWDRKGDWDKAHDLVNDLDNRQAAHVHAYLHRKEGDLWNVDYWYRRAKRQRHSGTLEEEWEELVKIML